MSWKLWLDDQINDPVTPNRHPPEGWTGASSYEEAILLIELHGWPSHVSFDHDLGEGKKTGYDFAKWLVEKDMDNMSFLEYSYNIHSANPVGAANIKGLLDGWFREKENRINQNNLDHNISPE